MLGKVMKHEMKATVKVLLPLQLILIGITLAGTIMLHMQIFETDMGALVGAAMLILYIIGMVALTVTAFIFLLVRFYRSMYGTEGYLSHTLPVTTFSLINGKLLVATFWYAVTTALTYISIFVLLITAGLNLGEGGAGYGLKQLLGELEQMIGISIPALAGWMILYSLVMALSSMLMVYASMAVGQLFRHKVVMSVVVYGIFYVIMQVSAFMFSIGAANNFVESQMELADDSFFTLQIAAMYGNLFSKSMVLALILSVVFYIITALITHKKLNLE